jgi:serine/threonine-protein kinase
MQRLWEEIRQRNLHRVTAAYAVVAWVLVQAAGLLFPAFGIPDWALRLPVLLLIAALPVLWVALWLSHPEPAHDEAKPSPLHHTEWTLIGLLALVTIVSVGEFAYSQFKGEASAAREAVTPQDASIAVLAFDNMSDDAKNEFFSEGISEELLNDLSQVRGLRVAGRTSSFSFKGKNAGIHEIGKALNVRTVLEGSVRREGNRVRITAQLINAADDTHIWSHEYDREISDIFAVQGEISRAITSELTGRLMGATPAKTGAQPQINPQAYTAYLKGRFFLNKRNRDAMVNAVGFFKQAIALEPAYSIAHADLALAYALQISNGQRRDALDLAQAEAATAMRLAPDNFESILANAVVEQTSWKWSPANMDFQKLLARYPLNADVHHFYGVFLMDMHLPEGWLSEHRQAAALDPLSPVDQENIAEALHALGRNDEAIAAYQMAIAMDPDLVFTLAQLCVSYAEKGSVEQAKGILNERLIAVDGEGNYTARCRTAIARQEPGATNTLRKLAQDAERGHAEGRVGASLVGLIYAQAGDGDTALKWFKTSVADRELKFFQNTCGRVLPDAFAADPRWISFMTGPDFQDWARVRTLVAGHGANG